MNQPIATPSPIKAGVTFLVSIRIIFCIFGKCLKLRRMKKLSILLCLVLIALLPSCGPTHSVVTGYIDYSKYSDQGFFITEAPTVPFDYTPIGSMSVTEYSGKDKEYVVESVQTNDKEYDNLYAPERTKTSHWREATPMSALSAIVERAKSIGANGIMSLQLLPVYEKKNIIGYTVSGMLIKH